MKTLLLLLFMAVSLSVDAQQKSSVSTTKMPADQESFCLTSDADLFMFFFNNIKYPVEAAAKKLEGTLMLSVDVQNDSSIVNIKTFSSLGYTIEDQAKLVVKKLKFAPSIQNGYQVRSNLMLNVPIRAH